MRDEVTDLMKTLGFIIGVINQNKGDVLREIGEAYWDAQELVTSIQPENGSSRSRILACFARLDAYKASNDVAAFGWMLTALQQRIHEREFPEWERLAAMIDDAVTLLPRRTLN